MRLHLPSDSGVTLIENTFIDQYMPAANGEFVKLYLYLLRCAGTGRELSISSIADFFDHTEKDVRRALAYWEKLSLLKLQYDASDNITDIVFTAGIPANRSAVSLNGSAGSGDLLQGTAEDSRQERAAASQGSVPPGNVLPLQSEQAPALPASKAIPAARRAQLRQQEDIRQLVYVQERYLGRPLTTSEISNLLYVYEKLHFSPDLIDYLLEYCASKGNPGSRYMEKVAQGWFLEGITTVEQAKAAGAAFSKQYHAIFRALGLGSRSPAPAETQYMDRWLREYGFSVELVTEACNRTIRQTHQASFDYADGILKSWSEKKVHSLADVEKLDQAFQQKKEEALSGSPARPARSGGGSSRKRSGAGNTFSSMPQRDYDWSALEKQLLRSQENGLKKAVQDGVKEEQV